jgi:hypothetical protein
MRIEFTRGGGFAAPALRQNYEINSDDLPPSEAEELHRLVEASDVANLAGQSAIQQPRPDAFHYRVTIEEGGSSHTIKTSDADMPASIRSLIEWLTERASRHSQ